MHTYGKGECKNNFGLKLWRREISWNKLQMLGFMSVLKDKWSDCGLDSSGLWQGPAVGSLETSFPNFLSSWMTSYLPKSDTVMLLPVANITHCHHFIHILLSVMWLSGHTAITHWQYHLYSKAVHHPGSNTYSQKQSTHYHWNNRKLHYNELHSLVCFTKSKQRI